MTLLAPWAMWFFAIGAGVVALYLLKIKRRRQEVPALEFWRELAGPAPVRSLFQRLKRWLSMLLWLIIVTCLVLSLGNPVLSMGKVRPRSIAVILDNSASMQAAEGDGETGTRFDLAKAALEDLTTLRPVEDQWLLIEAARRPRVMQPWTRNSRDIREAAAKLTPFIGASNPAEAHKLAEQLLAGKENPLIVFLSDGAAGRIEELMRKQLPVQPVAPVTTAEAGMLPPTKPVPPADGIETVLWPIGAAQDNLGITRLSVRIDPQQAAHYAFVSLLNASGEAVESQIVFELDGTTIDVQPFTVEPAGTWKRTITLTAPQGGVLRAWIDRPDALAVDNEAFAVVKPIRPARILLVSNPEDAFFFEQALLAMEPLVDLDASRTITTPEFDEANQPGNGALADTDLIIFNNVSPARLPDSGAFLCVNAWPQEVPARIVGELTAPSMSLADRNHALTQYLSIGSTLLARAHEVDLHERAVFLADSASGAPLIFLFRRPDQLILCLAFNVLESDLPFRNAFPVFLRNAVSYLVTERDAWLPDTCSIGETITPLRPLAESIGEVRVARPNRDVVTEETLPVRGATFQFDHTAEPGPLRIAIGDEYAYTAVNLTDPAETQIVATTIEVEPREKLALSGRLFGTVPWVALAALATLLLAGEWLTYHFRWTE